MRGNTATISLTAFHADWMTHIPMRVLCERWTISRDQVIRLAEVWDLPRRHDRKLRARQVRQRDPTPREIARMSREIQATWSEDTREDRRVIKTQHVSLRRIELTDETRRATELPESDGPVWEVER
jgi:hypothetical protein